MYSVRARLMVLAALETAAVLVLGASTSSASPTWPTCLGEPATIVGTDGNDTLNGTSGDDVIVGLGGDDVITSGESDEGDLICAGDGNDLVLVNGSGLFSSTVVSGDAGDDRIQGSKDAFVEVDYESSPEPVTVDLGAGTETGWGNDTLVRVTIVDGSKFDDTMKGSGGLNGLYGDAGNDTLSGLGGPDYLPGGPGDDKIDGGPGYDWLDYWDAPAGVQVRLAKGTATGGGGNDTFHSMEGVFGSKYADVLVGGTGADHLEGYNGNDKLYGGKGKDFLDGGKGKDRADGGRARDVCHAEKRVHCP
jgi:Ca2+-binding RTX toxin-like protein